MGKEGRGVGPTIYDVARVAGVSLATVSRVVNQRPNVRPETRQKVLAAMKELNYRPNLIASALMTGRTATIGLLVPDITNPFFAEICRGVEDAGFAMGFSVMICNTDEKLEKERWYIDVLRNKGVEGIILASPEVNDPNIAALHAEGFPIVLLTRGVDAPEVPSVGVDDFRGGYLATEYLLRLGHRRVSLFGGPTRTRPGLYRKKGFEAAMEQYGVPVDPALVDEGEFTAASGAEQATRLLARQVPLPTAIVAGNDLIAIGAIKVLRRSGIRVPEDVSVIGFDLTALARDFDPEITSIAQPMQDLGSEAMRMLVERIREPAAPVRQILLPPRLSVGESTAPPRSGR